MNAEGAKSSARHQVKTSWWLAPVAASCLALMASTALFARPVNDDYWAIGELTAAGFVQSLEWYYVEFQGNVTSWFFILLHASQWLGGVTPLGASLSITAGFVVLGFGTWGGLVFVGVELPCGWRRWAVLVILTTGVWLSLASLISPNAMTATFYLVSSVVHIWPWAIALGCLGLVSRRRRSIGASTALVVLAFVAGSLGLVEAITLALSTLIVGLYGRWRRASFMWWRTGAIMWCAGLGLGLLLQVASPATWSRGSGLGSTEALATNVQAVERLLALSDRLVGPTASEQLLAALPIEGWARILVPAAAVGDVLLRPGLLALIVVSAWWASVRPGSWSLTSRGMNTRVVALTLALVPGIALYSLSGALYAYAGRHISGLALVASMLAVALGARWTGWFTRHTRVFTTLKVASLVVFVLLAVQQVAYGFVRATAWDAAQAINLEAIKQGRPQDLVSVPLKAGLSQSGLRDHDGSLAYQDWLLTWKR